ncbi:DUF1752-domain-containing protein [Amniculicola lignicola CBS 123094]|uniref:DUF1752-domain-containing protein n=1 Tax=Amniculicola lignicola CBS 123094 TaxID=1392246 RepID=A0A6A5W435_9PLEO|nr:DUF1752-domain-containing protein [Amniculicola lignicola CBS 123094]
MPLHSAHPIVHVVPSSMNSIETRNPENLFGLWLVFSKCSPAMEDGKRYENMAWRLWGRETFCCGRDHIIGSPPWAFERQLSPPATDLPELSSSVGSDDSIAESAITTATRSNSSSSRPDLRRHDSTNSQARGSHITPNELEKVVSSIKEKKELKHPIPTLPQLSYPLPERTAPAAPTTPQQTTPERTSAEDTTPRPSSPPAARFVPEPSASTLSTGMASNTSPVIGSDTSASTESSAHSVVHGFEPGRISTSHRSSTLLTPTPILKTGGQMRPPASAAKPAATKKSMFTLGASSDEDGSSFENSMVHRNSPMVMRSSLSDNIKKSGNMKKVTSFSQHVSTRTLDPVDSADSEDAIVTDSEDDESEDENAIEEDESDEWEDDNENENESGSSSLNEKALFQRVDSRPNLRSQRSLLTTMMHEKDRAQALQNQASRSTPAIRRSRTSTPNGPSTGNSPQEDSGLMMRQVPRSKPIIMTTSNVHPPALSPRTTRRNMLQTELTQSLRQNLLWERQQKNATTNAVNKRHQSAVSIPALRRAATTNDIKGLQAFPQQNMNKSATFKEAAKNPNSYNDYFDQGLQEYHQKGW